MITVGEANSLRKLIITDESDRLAGIFSALGEPGRFRMFKIIAARHNVCVSEVAHILGISVPAASQQFRVLEMTGIVLRKRHGQMICYEIRGDDPTIKMLMKIINKGRSKIITNAKKKKKY